MVYHDDYTSLGQEILRWGIFYILVKEEERVGALLFLTTTQKRVLRYVFSASVLCHLCEMDALSLPRMWKNNEKMALKKDRQ